MIAFVFRCVREHGFVCVCEFGFGFEWCWVLLCILV